LGGVPLLHRTDRMTAAVNNLTEMAEFQKSYEALMRQIFRAIELLRHQSAIPASRMVSGWAVGATFAGRFRPSLLPISAGVDPSSFESRCGTPVL
jgi:hypothetical protein